MDRRISDKAMNQFRWLLVWVLSACLCASVTARAVAGLDVVLSSGVASPDGNGTLSAFPGPALNDAGQLAFVATLTGTSGGTADDQALYRFGDSGLTLIHHKGQQLLGANSIAFFASAGHLDESGNVASVAVFLDPTAVTRYFLGSGGPIVPVVAPGSPSPSGNNSFLGMTTLGVNASGLAVFRAIYSGSNVESGLYNRAADSTISIRLKQNIPAPRGGTIQSAGGRPTMNESGQIGTILGVNTPSLIESVSRVDGTVVTELAREGDLLADGMTTIGEIRSEAALINEAGQIAFAADYTRPGTAGQGVFLADPAGVTLIAPGLLPGATSGSNNVQVAGISTAGRVALTTEFLAGNPDPASAIYLADTAGQTLIAYEDTATPVAGKFFRTFYNDRTALNDAGQLAFLAELSDSANGAAAGNGIFYYDPATGLEQIARTGDALAGSTIASVNFSGGVPSTQTQSPDLSLSGLNNAGQVAFSYTLANGQQGIALWSPDLPGDFNHDGLVDAADYTVWRDGLNATFGPSQYQLWKDNFGRTAPGSGAASATVPEPGLPCSLAIGLILNHRRSRLRRSKMLRMELLARV